MLTHTIAPSYTLESMPFFVKWKSNSSKLKNDLIKIVEKLSSGQLKD